MTDEEIDAAFAEMRTVASEVDLVDWLYRNGAVLYANGRRHTVYTLKVQEEPTWRFRSLVMRGHHFMQAVPVCWLDLQFEIEGNDPQQTMRRMFTDSGIHLREMVEGANTITARVTITGDDFASMFVRRKLEEE